MNILNCKICIIKIGSALVVDEKAGKVNQTWIKGLIQDVLLLRKFGINVILVSSGAIACGKLKLSMAQNKVDMPIEMKQAVSAIGQVQLLQAYQSVLDTYDITAAQVLLTFDDTENENRVFNLKNTLNELLSLGVVPIINENDSVATDEIRYGDNDCLSAQVAEVMGADLLILLSDIDGLYTDDPKMNPSAQFIQMVDDLSPDILAMAKEASTPHGTGGMKTKLIAANIAMNAGTHLLIIKGTYENPIERYLKTKKGTWFIANKKPFDFIFSKEENKTLQQNKVTLNKE